MKDSRLIIGIASPIVSFSFIAMAIHIHPWFDWRANALSDLGAMSTGNSWVFNLGLVLGGILSMVFSTLLVSIARHPLEKVGAWMFLFASFSMALTGVFPEEMSIHYVVAVSFYLLSVIAMCIYGVHLWYRHMWYGPASLALVAVGLILAFMPDWSAIAIPEAIGASAITAWMYMMIYGIEKGGIKWTTGME